jgi:uncharacterized protein (DUF1697 family)
MAGYVALLRGINVGGKNLIKMTDLKACFEAQGFTGVSTYIASGNVIFSASGGRGELERKIEGALSARFGYRASVMLRNKKQMQEVIGRAPEGFGADPVAHRYDVLFLKDALTPAAALKSVPTREGVDLVFAGPGCLYFSRVTARAAQSQLSRIVSMPIYQSMTIRNWATTSALARMISGPQLGLAGGVEPSRTRR